MQDGGQPPFRVVVSSTPHSTTVHVAGELDLATGAMLSERIDRLSEGQTTRHVTLDLGDVTFIDVAGIRSVIRNRDSLSRRGFHVTFGRMSTVTCRIIALTGLDIEPEPMRAN